jgi:hypothetical protein
MLRSFLQHFLTGSETPVADHVAGTQESSTDVFNNSIHHQHDVHAAIDNAAIAPLLHPSATVQPPVKSRLSSFFASESLDEVRINNGRPVLVHMQRRRR